jgi:hypothetical protein
MTYFLEERFTVRDLRADRFRQSEVTFAIGLEPDPDFQRDPPNEKASPGSLSIGRHPSTGSSARSL